MVVMLYWQIGQRIRQDILKEKRAEYGEQILSALRRELSWSHFRWSKENRWDTRQNGSRGQQDKQEEMTLEDPPVHPQSSVAAP
jgi:hypothetical protein